jgi:hypothetical protein
MDFLFPLLSAEEFFMIEEFLLRDEEFPMEDENDESAITFEDLVPDVSGLDFTFVKEDDMSASDFRRFVWTVHRASSLERASLERASLERASLGVSTRPSYLGAPFFGYTASA